MRIILTISDELYRRAQHEASASGASISRVIEQAIQAYLSRVDSSGREAAPLPSFEGFEPVGGIDFIQTSELLHDLEATR